MRNMLQPVVVNLHSSGMRALTAPVIPNTRLISDDFPTPAWWAIRVDGKKERQQLTRPTDRIRNLNH